MSASFIGIDLAWAPKNGSGLAALTPKGAGSRSADRLVVAAAEVRRGDDEIVAFVREHMAATTVILVDAPLVIPNATGMRECDRLTHRRFGRQQAGCYPANRGNMGRYTGGAPRGETLGRQLEGLGFHWPPGGLPSPSRAVGLRIFECYPHPAQVVLFHLPITLKYKRKRQGAERARAEFARYLSLCRGLRHPSIEFGGALLRELDASQARGRAYKECEDKLDAIFCAYLSALVPRGRLEMLGRPEEGSIVVPKTSRLMPPSGSAAPRRSPADRW